MVSCIKNYVIKNSNNVVNLICTKKIPLNKVFGLSKHIFPGIFQIKVHLTLDLKVNTRS